MTESRVVYVVGASGVGKDTLLHYARRRLCERHPVVFAHRYITRAPTPSGENHVALSPEEFDLRRRRGLFAMLWQSHGTSYGIGVEIDQWLAAGLTVVVNGSREYLPRAQQRYPDLEVVWITADPQITAARLAARGRESAEAIVERLRRAPRPQCAARAAYLDNSGPVEEAGERLVGVLVGRRS